METKQLQKKAVGMVDTLDRKFSVERDAQLNFTQMVEEVGELAKEINLPRLRSRDADKNNLEGEFADIFLLLSKMAEMCNVDLETAVENKLKALEKRHMLV
ncbi:MAG: hypothetical protein DRO99_02640 [Candidatus Aenigmatarchaeota archaeon]|nr:MAG: hypothetical protein DRO99_02640 [Candidatus Aenigmarchaeota archaeon]